MPWRRSRRSSNRPRARSSPPPPAAGCSRRSCATSRSCPSRTPPASSGPWTASPSRRRRAAGRPGGAPGRAAGAGLARPGAAFPPRLPVGLPPASERQLLALAAALEARPALLIPDEPTAALGEAESERLFAVLRGLRDAGRSVLYVSHRLAEVLALSDRITVLRDGLRVRTCARGEVDAGAL